MDGALSSHAIVTRVTTSDDDDVLALRREVVAILELRIEEGASVELQELHS